MTTYDRKLRAEVLATWVTLNTKLEELSSVDLDRCLQLELASTSPRPTVARRLLGRICRLQRNAQFELLEKKLGARERR